MKRALLIACSVVAAPLESRATDLPLETLALGDTASVQERLELQTSSYLSYERSADQRFDALGASLELELGVWDRVQVMLAVPFVHQQADLATVNGLAPVELGASAALVDRGRFLLTAGAELELPASDERIGEVGVGGGPFLLADLDLHALHLASSAGLELEAGDELELSPAFGAGIYTSLGPVTPTLELASVFAEETEVSAATGVFVDFAEDWELGLAGKLGVTSAAPDRGALFVLTYEAELGPASEEDDE